MGIAYKKIGAGFVGLGISALMVPALAVDKNQDTYQQNTYQPGYYNHHQGGYIGANLGAGLGGFKNSGGNAKGGFSGVGGGVLGGYQFNPYVAAEGGVWALEGIITTFVFYDLAAKGMLPLGTRTNLFGKFGVAGIYNSVCLASVCNSENNVGPFIGGGLGVALTQNWDMNFEYDGVIHDNAAGSGVVGLLTLGAIYHFD